MTIVANTRIFNTVNQVFDTFKAAANGMDRLYRGVVHDPNRAAIAIKTGLLAMASIGLLLQNRDNPRYNELEEWDKDTHWLPC